MKSANTYDFIVLGAGIVGLTIARALKKKYADTTILLIEKEKSLGLHGSGRNSGVLHSGIYYASGTLKANLCADGASRLKKFCHAEGLPLNPIGKIVIPTSLANDKTLDVLLERGLLNGAKVALLDEKALYELEPFANSATGRALMVEETSVIAPLRVVDRIQEKLAACGVQIMSGYSVEKFAVSDSCIRVNKKIINYGHIINATGQHADKIAHQFGVGLDYRIVPFRGSYYQLSKASKIKINHLIYPTPDIEVPFLGVHTVTTSDNKTYFGPTAVPAFGREHYSGIQGIELKESVFILGRLASLYYHNNGGFRGYAHSEASRMTKNRFVHACRSIIKNLSASDLVPCNKVGIRAQLIDIKNKSLEMDFMVKTKSNSTHILNAVSPAFTSSFAFADYIVNQKI